MNRKKFITLIISLFVMSSIYMLNSCKKEVAVYTLSGETTDASNSTGLNNVHVSLKASKVSSGVYNPNYEEVGNATTNSSGIYSIEIEHENVSGYRVDFTKKDYFDQSIDLKTEQLQSDNGYEVNASMIPIGFLKLDVKNTSPQASDDEIRFYLSNVNVKCKDCWNSDVIIGTGPSYVYSETKQLAGEQDIIINWVVTKKGTQHIYQDTIRSKAFSTISFKIDY